MARGRKPVPYRLSVSLEQGKREAMWFHNTVFYQVLIRSFKDSDGDGLGDIRGLVSELDYVSSLGVGAIYLNPVTAAAFDPSRSDYDKDQYAGYGSVDLKRIDPYYGTLDDFRALVSEAHARGLKVVIDCLTLGLSRSHPFVADVWSRGRSSPYSDFFLIRGKVPEGNWLSHGGPAWRPMPDGRFYHSFWRDYAALDYRNPRVKSFFLDVADFWLSEGVDGLRLDAAKYLFCNGPGVVRQEHQPETIEFWRRFKRHLISCFGEERILVAEILPIPRRVDYVGKDREMMDFLYDGVLAEGMFSSPQVDVDSLTGEYCGS